MKGDKRFLIESVKRINLTQEIVNELSYNYRRKMKGVKVIYAGKQAYERLG